MSIFKIQIKIIIIIPITILVPISTIVIVIIFSINDLFFLSNVFQSLLQRGAMSSLHSQPLPRLLNVNIFLNIHFPPFYSRR